MSEEMREACAAALQRVLMQCGVRPIAEGVGVKPQSVSNWSAVPPRHVIAVERLSGISRTELRPDLYPPAGSDRQIVVRPLIKRGPPLRSRVADLAR